MHMLDWNTYRQQLLAGVGGFGKLNPDIIKGYTTLSRAGQKAGHLDEKTRERGLRFDPELLYAGAMFHDMGLTHQHSSTHERFEVDSANAARDFLRSHGVHQHDVETVWTAIALHTTPGIPQHMHPVVALVTAGVEMDVLGLAYSEYSDVEREAVVHAHPRPPHFKEDIIQAFYDGNKHKPETTFGNVNADVLADKDPRFTRVNFCSVIRGSAWRG